MGDEGVAQRVLCIDGLTGLFPAPGEPFDLWHEGLAWASKVRREPCVCTQQPAPHCHHYLEGGEIHAGMRWEIGAQLHFRRDEGGRILVWGDLDA